VGESISNSPAGRNPAGDAAVTRLYGKLEATDTSLLTWLGGLSNAENRQRRQYE